MKRLYCEELDQVRWTAEGKARLAHSLNATLEGKTVARPRQGIRAVAIAIAAICALAVGAAAVGIPVLQAHYGGGAGYKQSSTLVGQSVTTQGWTLTLTDCVGDDRYMVLGFELEAPEGTVLDQEEYRPRKDRPGFTKEVGMSSWAWRQLKDEDPTDNKLYFGLWIENIQDEIGDPGLNAQTMELCIEGLEYPAWNTETEEWEDITVFDGTWDFGTLTISYPDRTLRMKPNTVVTVLGVPATITHLEVSPIGVDVWFEGDELKGHDGWFPWRGQCIQEPEITLYNKAGNALIPDKYTPFGIRGGSGCNGNPNVTEEDKGPFVLNIIQSYGYLLDMDELDHIDICGVSISLA